MDILTKKESFILFEKGLFGNKLKTWSSVNDYNESKHVGSVTVRYLGKSNVLGGAYCKYNVTDVDSVINEFAKLGADRNLFIINESAPDDNLLIQGEITHDYNGYQLFYSLEKGKMRDCLKNGISVTGLQAKIIIQHYMFPNSFNDIIELIELYPNHVIEFSTYNHAIGDCHNRNTVIWEVRKY